MQDPSKNPTTAAVNGVDAAAVATRRRHRSFGVGGDFERMEEGLETARDREFDSYTAAERRYKSAMEALNDAKLTGKSEEIIRTWKQTMKEAKVDMAMAEIGRAHV